MDSASDVAQQIKILLNGLAQRAESTGLQELARRLREVAGEVHELAGKSRPRN
jgi:hypothetical protein